MRDFFISVVIPTLNEEKYLPKILGDLRCQKEKNFEVVIVDANSQDKTVEVARSFSNEIPLSVFKVNKKNVSYQRNYGAKKAVGSFLLFLDADSRINPSFIKNITLSVHKTGAKLLLPYITPEKGLVAHKIIFKLANLIVRTSQTFGKPFSTGGSFLIGRDLFSMCGGFDEKLYLGEDHDLVNRVHYWGVKAKLLSNTQIIVSLRRTKQEGQLGVLYKYLLAASYILINGKITYKIFEYKMGGAQYDFVKKGYILPPKLELLKRLLQPSQSLLLAILVATFLLTAYMNSFNIDGSRFEKVNLSYEKYKNAVIENVIEPIKYISLREFQQFNKRSSEVYTTGFLSS